MVEKEMREMRGIGVRKCNSRSKTWLGLIEDNAASSGPRRCGLIDLEVVMTVYNGTSRDYY